MRISTKLNTSILSVDVHSFILFYFILIDFYLFLGCYNVCRYMYVGPAYKYFAHDLAYLNFYIVELQIPQLCKHSVDSMGHHGKLMDIRIDSILL